MYILLAVCRFKGSLIVPSNLQERVGIVVNEDGQPVLSAFTFPAWPTALAATQHFVLAVYSNTVYVFETTSSKPVQTISLSSSQQAASADDGLRIAKDPSSDHSLVSGHRKVGSRAIHLVLCPNLHFL